jgi:hypothetical protein
VAKNPRHTNICNNGGKAYFFVDSSKYLPTMSSRKTMVTRRERYHSNNSSSVEISKGLVRSWMTLFEGRFLNLSKFLNFRRLRRLLAILNLQHFAWGKC